MHMDHTYMDFSYLSVDMYIYTNKLEIYFFHFQCFFYAVSLWTFDR